MEYGIMADNDVIADTVMGSSDADTAGAAFGIDFEKYLAHTRAFDMSENQQRQLIEALWNVLMALLDFKYGIHPAQSALEARDARALACGKVGKSGALANPLVADVVRSIITQSDDLKDSFHENAGSPDHMQDRA